MIHLLPDELISAILSYTSLIDICRLTSVCKKFHIICDKPHDILWDTFTQHHKQFNKNYNLKYQLSKFRSGWRRFLSIFSNNDNLQWVNNRNLQHLVIDNKCKSVQIIQKGNTTTRCNYPLFHNTTKFFEIK